MQEIEGGGHLLEGGVFLGAYGITTCSLSQPFISRVDTDLVLSMFCSGVDRASGQVEKPGWRERHCKCFKFNSFSCQEG